MTGDDLQDRLSRIQTQWTQMLAPVAGAEKDLLLHYYGAAYRYLRALAKDAALAEDLAQEFAARFLAGQYRRVDREHGRFRDFLKACLRNLMHDHWRRQHKGPQPVAALDQVEPAAPLEPVGDDSFEASWRDALLARTWEALAKYEADAGKPYCAILRLKTGTPALRSQELAKRLGQALGKSLSAEAARQTLHRAREMFADLLLDEVGRTLPARARDQLEEELIEVQLIDYCRKALDRRFPSERDRARP
jgi:RNA polymerase sigma factor (sigma-70 family)